MAARFVAGKKTRFVATRFAAGRKTRFVTTRFVADKKTRFVATGFVAGKKKLVSWVSRGSRGQIKYNHELKGVIKSQPFIEIFLAFQQFLCVSL